MSKKAPAPKHSHYVSLSNNCVYPAMRSPSGFEDGQPKSWRPATSHEISLYRDGEPLQPVIGDDEVDLTEATPARAAPVAVKLADEDPAPFVPQAQPAPAPIAPPPPSFVAPSAPPAPPIVVPTEPALGPAKE